MGGVSTSTYWLARALAERGHEIHVVTNAREVEDAYRLTLAQDAPDYEPRFPASEGVVHVHDAQPYRRQTMNHIPASNPFVTKLASLATDVIRHHGCEAVLAYYYEPYGMAGWLASRWTGRSLIVKHAGSDLDRLFRARLGDGLQRGAALGRGRRHPAGPDVGALSAWASCRRGCSSTSRSRSPTNLPSEAQGKSEPVVEAVIGVYGKIGETKGTWDLVAALGGRAGEGTPV